MLVENAKATMPFFIIPGIQSVFQHTDPTRRLVSIAPTYHVVAIDAPCGWSQDGSAREAERILQYHQTRIPCFCTPTRERAKQSRFYDWVFNGEKIYQAFQRQSITPIETYPHGISEIILQRNPSPLKSKHDAKQRSPRIGLSRPLIHQ